MSESHFEREEEEAAAAEAARIGGRVSYDPPLEDGAAVDPAEAPLIEAGEGVSEGFELAEQALEEHASHGDQHAARRVIEDAYLFDEPDDPGAPEPAEAGEADQERPPDV